MALFPGTESQNAIHGPAGIMNENFGAMFIKRSRRNHFRCHPAGVTDGVKRLNDRFAELDGLLLDALEKWEVIEARAKA